MVASRFYESTEGRGKYRYSSRDLLLPWRKFVVSDLLFFTPLEGFQLGAVEVFEMGLVFAGRMIGAWARATRRPVVSS